MSTLIKHPEIAARVGIYIATFSELEILLPAALTSASGLSQPISMAILMQFRNISDRVDVIDDVIKAGGFKHASATLVSSLVPAIRAANTRRNELAHGMYGEFENGEVFIVTWVFSKTPKRTKELTIDAGELDQDILALGELLRRVTHAVVSPLEPWPENSPPRPLPEHRKPNDPKPTRSERPARPPSSRG
ncbi:hypothetical protein [Brevundimonas sp.]|uniref:hypothetical protein n=1 Tax=Brevundimonas sp. TaxID=1871086 RepID=UPI003F71C8CD